MTERMTILVVGITSCKKTSKSKIEVSLAVLTYLYVVEAMFLKVSRYEGFLMALNRTTCCRKTKHASLSILGIVLYRLN